MPDEFVTVYLKDTGAPAQMHSVDAAEAVRIGDYVMQPPPGTDLDPEAVAHAKARMTGIGTATHPELQTPEEREVSRREANEAAADLATRQRIMQGLPAVAPVVPMGPAMHPHHVPLVAEPYVAEPHPEHHVVPHVVESSSQPHVSPATAGGSTTTSTSSKK